MAQPFSETKRAALKKRVSELYLAGYEQLEIAAHLKISQGTVSNYIKDLSNDWIEDGKFNFDEARKAELARINTLELEAWEAWKRSCRIKKKSTKTTGISSQGSHVDELSETKWKDAGDPRFLAQIQWCIDKRCEILGLNAPKKTEIGGEAITSLYDWIRVITENANKS